jgi:hypothetical protein
MNFSSQPRGTFFALALIVAGAILFLDNIGILPIDNVGAYWPMAFVVYGVGVALRKLSPTSLVWSGALIVFGVLLTLGNLGIVHATMAVAWPLLLIAFGVTALVHRSWWANTKWPSADWNKDAWEQGTYGRWKWTDQAFATKHEWRHWRREQRRKRWDRHAETTKDGRLDEVAVFFSLKRSMEGREIQDGEVVAVFGSVELDFRGATIPLTTPDGAGATPVRRAEVEATAVFGSVEIRVPSNWSVIKEGTGVFGSYEDRTLPFRPDPGVEPPTLVIRGGAVFGSVTIEG